MENSALFLLQAVVGTFFAISGYHKLFHPARHASLVATLRENGIPAIPIMQWWVPFWELAAGAGLVFTSGVWVVACAVPLFVICVVACCTDGRKRVESTPALDLADRIDTALYLPEVLLAVALASIILLSI